MIGFALIAVASLASSSLVAAQQDGVGIGNQTIIPTSVDINTRNGWCRSEKDTCTTLCSKNWSTNDCDQNTLEVSCVCADGSKPELVNYRNTLPFFICLEYIAQCVAGNATEPALQNICRNTNTCGNLDPADFVPSTTIRTTAPAPSTTGSSTGGTNTPATTTGSTDAPATTSPNAAGSLDPPSFGFLRMVALLSALGVAGAGFIL
ncbi:hypothetical protein EYR41_005211 [Orbilia oligospora]|uniref:DUF7707 domain-containing protein n=1 Tax=Orbilia oligospora TaxID=2813651 RepID=A0A7C8PXD6_ORBOL|nr:hypothetical protein TWF751_005994 [Orbilia oligospora]KAF3263025.1 hypothetical protein TWF128_001999 [Orbilia oligospora]KAF3267397.1 hypothetical protein TWF217_000461 [Orbilia oligospora]TGJ69150.1 hypothetical protein EYR41_005211 [Orbilia oligospora]